MLVMEQEQAENSSGCSSLCDPVVASISEAWTEYEFVLRFQSEHNSNLNVEIYNSELRARNVNLVVTTSVRQVRATEWDKRERVQQLNQKEL